MPFPLCGARLVYSRHISRRSLSSISDNFKPFKLINRIISYIDEVTGVTEIREAHATLKEVIFEKNVSWGSNIYGS